MVKVFLTSTPIIKQKSEVSSVKLDVRSLALPFSWSLFYPSKSPLKQLKLGLRTTGSR